MEIKITKKEQKTMYKAFVNYDNAEKLVQMWHSNSVYKDNYIRKRDSDREAFREACTTLKVMVEEVERRCSARTASIYTIYDELRKIRDFYDFIPDTYFSGVTFKINTHYTKLPNSYTYSNTANSTFIDGYFDKGIPYITNVYRNNCEIRTRISVKNDEIKERVLMHYHIEEV